MRTQITPGHYEHEAMVVVDGIQIPQSQLAAYREARKAAKELADKERATAKPALYCPITRTQCHNNCALRINEQCAIVLIAERSVIND